MKKFIMMIFAFVSVFVFSSKVEAAYDGKIGYEQHSGTYVFYYYTDRENPKIYLNIIKDSGDLKRELTFDEGGIYLYIASSGEVEVEDKYNYTICDMNDENCITTIDPFSPYLSNDGTSNIVLDTTYMEPEWKDKDNKNVTDYSKSIYAIDVEQFVEDIDDPVVDGKTSFSVFDKMIVESSKGNTPVGMNYLKSVGFTHLEMFGLYHPNHYMGVNNLYSNMTHEYSALQEYQDMHQKYKSFNMNLVLRTNFATPSPTLAQALNVISSEAVVDGKINFDNPIAQRYLKEVYKTWVSNYYINGFYIEDSGLYTPAFLNSLISELKTINAGLYIYTSTDIGGFTTSDELQNLLFGSLNSFDSKGIINGHYSEDELKKLTSAMFSGYYDSRKGYENAANIINNIGSFSGMDVYSKVRGAYGMTADNNDITSKIQLALYTIYASAGTPRIVGGNEFYNTNLSNGQGIDESEKACVSASVCYLKGNSKKLDWDHLKNVGNQLQIISNYRKSYYYQFPSLYTLENSQEMSINEGLLEKGVIYLTIGYQAIANGDFQKSILIINFSDENVDMEHLSEGSYDRVSALVGSVSSVDEKARIAKNTFYTYTEVRDVRLPQWVYILVGIGLVGAMLAIRQFCIYLLKKKHGIDYNDLKPASRWKFGKKKTGNNEQTTQMKETSIFETFLADDPLIKERREKRKQEKANKKKESEKEDDDKKEGE